MVGLFESVVLFTVLFVIFKYQTNGFMNEIKNSVIPVVYISNLECRDAISNIPVAISRLFFPSLTVLFCCCHLTIWLEGKMKETDNDLSLYSYIYIYWFRIFSSYNAASLLSTANVNTHFDMSVTDGFFLICCLTWDFLRDRILSLFIPPFLLSIDQC